MADRLISADALKREMWRRCGETDIEIDKGRAKWDSGLWIRYKVFEDCLAVAPRVEPKHGHWIDTGSGQECSVCGEIQYGYDSYRFYCANCGSRMNEVEES